MGNIRHIVERLDRARAGLESAARRIPAELWRIPPRSGAWSAAEVIAHLTMVEGAITDGAGRLLRGAPPHVPLWRRVHLPVRLAEWRGLRRQTPIPLDASLVADRETMLARLSEVRGRTTALLEGQSGRELSAYRWKHPFFGSLNFYAWFRVIAHHEVRHTKQLREIGEIFQK